MSTDVEIDTVSVSVTLPSSQLAGIDRETRRFGLQRDSYFVLLHELHSGKVSPALAASVQEIFTRDRDLLKELAK